LFADLDFVGLLPEAELACLFADRELVGLLPDAELSDLFADLEFDVLLEDLELPRAPSGSFHELLSSFCFLILFLDSLFG